MHSTPHARRLELVSSLSNELRHGRALVAYRSQVSHAPRHNQKHHFYSCALKWIRYCKEIRQLKEASSSLVYNLPPAIVCRIRSGSLGF